MSATAPKKFLITGANSGIGLAASRQFALKDGAEKVILACRNEDKARTAQSDLENNTCKFDTFEVLLMDVMDFKSVRDAVSSLKENGRSLDCLVLNAGGPGGSDHTAQTKDGIANIMALNVTGHALLVKELIQNNLLNKGATVLYISSEAARGVEKFNFPAPKLESGSVEEFQSAIDGTKFTKTLKDTSYETAYSWAKFIGTIWTSSMARKEKDYRFLSVSPGMTTGTNLVNDLGFFKRTMFKVLSPIVQMLGISHDTEVGAKRYLDAVYMPEKYQNGLFYGCTKDAFTGEMVEQTDIFKELGNEKYQDNAYEAVESFIGRK